MVRLEVTPDTWRKVTLPLLPESREWTTTAEVIFYFGQRDGFSVIQRMGLFFSCGIFEKYSQFVKIEKNELD